MAKGRIKNLYFEWLIKKVCDSEHMTNYRELLQILFWTDFTFTNPRDKNREYDGFDLRDAFIDDIDIPYRQAALALDFPCTVLEVLVALSERCESSIMYDPSCGDRTAHWFWLMINNLMLSGMTDDNFDEGFVRDRIDIFMRRAYSKDGSNGGLFVVPNPPNDLRKTEIWYQMNWYLDTL